ncbi:MAG: alpha-mannosidase [Acetatifactor sp.]|nr:alpha-mannosidase [Acetatifactor sp.]
MKLMHSEWEGRLNHWIHTLKKDFYQPLGELKWTAYPTMEQIEPNEARKHAVTPVEAGYTWGMSREYCWFKSDLILPESAEGKRIVLNLNPGGESTLFVNGESFGTYRAGWLGIRHQYYSDNTIARNAHAGDSYEIMMETYAGHYFPESELGGCATGPVLPGAYEPPEEKGERCVLGVSTYGIWNEDCYQLYMDVMTLQSLMRVMDDTSLRAAHVAEALEKFTLTVDFEQDAEARNESYRQARAELAPVLGKMNGSTVPKFYAVGNAHLDLVWLWPIEETRRKTSRTFAAQLRLMEEYPEYKFIQSQPAEYEMCREHYPELFERIVKKVKDGQWIADGAMWVEPDTNMASGEALVRQVLYGKKYYKEMFGIDSELLWLPDTFGYSAVLPQILRKTGVKYLVTQKIFWSYNEGEEFPYHYFNWRGMDGSSIVTFLPTSYTYDTAPESMNRTWKERRQVHDLEGFLIPFGYGDGGGGPARDHIEYALRQKNLEGGVEVKLAGPTEFFEDMEKLGGPKETWDGELYFTAHRGTYTTQAMTKKNNRKNELLLRELEAWSALAQASGRLENGNEAQTEQLWKELLTLQFHDILPGSSIKEVYEYVEEKAEEIRESAGALLEKAKEALVEGSEKKKGALTVLNSLGFERSAIVELPQEFAKGAVTENGKKVPVQSENGKVQACVELPALGGISLVPCEETEITQKAYAIKTKDGVLMENDYVQVLINKDGEIISYRLNGFDCEFAKEPMNHLRMFKSVPRVFDAWDIDSNYALQEVEGARNTSVEIICSDGLRAQVKVTGIIGESEFEQIISLNAFGKRLDVEMTIDWKELHKLLKVAFPMNVFAQDAINEIQFGYVKRPTHKSRLSDKDRFEVSNHRYSALCDGSHGGAVLNDCKYGIGMNDSSLELSLLTAAASPEMRADNRKHTFRYGFTAWEGAFENSKVVQEGYEFNVEPQLVAGYTDTFSGFSADSDAVILDTVKPADDKSGDIIIRLYECYKSTCNTKVKLPLCEGRKVYLCDLLENKEQEVSVNGDEINLSFTPFEIKTLRVEK